MSLKCCAIAPAPSAGATPTIPSPKSWQEGDDLLEVMEMRRQFYGDLAFIEETLGIELPIPDALEMDDMNAAGTIANVLRTGEGTATFDQASGMVEDPLEIPSLADRFEREGARRRMVSYTLFGQEVELGLADYEIPRLKIVDVIPYGQAPTSPARVVLEAEDDDQMTFRLVNQSRAAA